MRMSAPLRQVLINGLARVTDSLLFVLTAVAVWPTAFRKKYDTILLTRSPRACSQHKVWIPTPTTPTEMAAMRIL